MVTSAKRGFRSAALRLVLAGALLLGTTAAVYRAAPRRTAGASAATSDGWRLMTVRSQGEYGRGEPGGRAEQYQQGAARCVANPDVIYLNHDCSQPWRSVDGGKTWEKPLALGLYLSLGQSIEVDPVDCNRVVAIMATGSSNWNSAFMGIYLSEDGGDHWSYVLSSPNLQSRRYEHNLAWAPSSADASGATRWYAALHDDGGTAASAIYVSDDRAKTWAKRASLAGKAPVYAIRVSPTDAARLLVASTAGLLASTDAGVTLSALGDLPSGAVTSLAISPTDAATVLAVVSGAGLFRSNDGGVHFTAVTSGTSAIQSVLSDAQGIFMSPADGRSFYVTPTSASASVPASAVRTTDGGATFAATSVSLAADVASQRWGRAFYGPFSFLLPSASSFADVVAQSGGAALYRSTDGTTFLNGSTYYDGANCGYGNYDIAFDRTDPDRIAFGFTDIGLYLTENRGDWFVQRAVPGSWRATESGTADPTTGCQVPAGSISKSMAMDVLDLQPGTKAIVAAAGRMGAQKLVYSADSGQTWTFADQNCAAYQRVVYHPTDTARVFAGNRISRDGGKTFTVMTFPAALPTAAMQVVDLCRANPDIMYAVNQVPGKIARSTDKGETWTVYTTVTWPFSGSTWIAAVDPKDCGVVYAVDQNQDLASYDGTSWHHYNLKSLVTVPSGLRIGVRSFLVDPVHPEVMYAALSADGIPNFFRSVDRGQTWQDVSLNRFRGSAWGINVNPHSGEVVVGSCSGTWVLPPPYALTDAMYPKLFSRPSCFDGLQDGDEEGVDCGGRCAAACSTGSGSGGSDSGGSGSTAGTTGEAHGGCGTAGGPGAGLALLTLLAALALPRRRPAVATRRR